MPNFSIFLMQKRTNLPIPFPVQGASDEPARFDAGQKPDPADRGFAKVHKVVGPGPARKQDHPGATKNGQGPML
jgi:hypothetical protein